MLIKNKRKPFFGLIKAIVRLFSKKPKFIFLGEGFKNGAIYISNHSAASGPKCYELYFPPAFRNWGTYEMFGSLKMRYKYLSKTYYHQKKHYPKFAANLVGGIFCLFSFLFYRGMKLIPSYPDSRLRETLNTSVNELEKGTSVLIFPEDSSKGYFETLTHYYPGFLALAETYYKRMQKDVLIYNMYYSKKNNIVIVDNPVSYAALKAGGKSMKELAEEFKNRANELFTKHIPPPETKSRRKVDLHIKDQTQAAGKK